MGHDTPLGRRRGHRRPLGTTTRVRFEWNASPYAEPRLEDVTIEDATERAYLVVGVEEHRDSPRVWWLTLERISLEEWGERIVAGARDWTHVRTPR